MTAAPGRRAGELVIDAKYVVAYAFDNPRPEGLTGPGDIVSFVRVDDRYVIRQGKNFARAATALARERRRQLLRAIGCDALSRATSPAVQQSETSRACRGTQESAGAYDPNQPLPQVDDLLRPVTHRVAARGTSWLLTP